MSTSNIINRRAVMTVGTYTRRNLKKLPATVKKTLEGLREYEWKYRPGREGDHVSLARSMKRMKTPPYTIIVFEELLDGSHRNDKRYVKISREKIRSELEETVFRYYDRELNERMMKYLEKHKDPEDVYLNKLIKEYYPKARRILREHYKEIYPRAWRRKFRPEVISKPRIRIRRERLYDLPEPLNFWDGRNLYQQYFIFPEERNLCKGGSGSSSQREAQSLYGFAFASFNRTVPVTTYIFLYDKHNELKYVDRIERLCLVPHDLGSNYHLERKNADRLLKGVLQAHISSWRSSTLKIELAERD
jgi:hypothetical protein